MTPVCNRDLAPTAGSGSCRWHFEFGRFRTTIKTRSSESFRIPRASIAKKIEPRNEKNPVGEPEGPSVQIQLASSTCLQVITVERQMFSVAHRKRQAFIFNVSAPPLDACKVQLERHSHAHTLTLFCTIMSDVAHSDDWVTTTWVVMKKQGRTRDSELRRPDVNTRRSSRAIL